MFRKNNQRTRQNLSNICKDCVIAIREILQIMTSMIPRKKLSWDSASANLDTVSQRLFQKKLHHGFFSFEFGKFFQNRHKTQLLVNSSTEHIK